MTDCKTLILASIMLLASTFTAQAGYQHWLGEPEISKDFFPIMTWTSLEGDHKAGLQSIADCNFTVVGFADAPDLKQCEKLGLMAIARLPKDVAPWEGKWEDASEEVVDSTFKQRIEKAGSSKAIIGYYICDEPDASKFLAYGKQVAAVEKYAPGKLAFINMLPGYAKAGAGEGYHGASDYTDFLERFVAEAKPQMISYDNYSVIYSDNGQSDNTYWKYFRNLAEVRRVSLEHGIPFWNIVCCNRIRPFTTVPSPANLMLQAYTTLAAGARGITWYRYDQGGYAYAPIDSAGNRTDTWNYLRMVNQQIKVLGPIMNRLKTTGIFFTNPPSLEELPPLPGRVVEAVESCTSLKGYSDAKPQIMVGEFRGEDGCDYVMLVNLSMEKSANIKLKTRNTYSARECISSQTGLASPLDEENGHWLVPGQGVLIRLVK